KSKTKTKIKPLLRKLNPRDEGSLDLSTSLAENESLAIYSSDFGIGSRSVAEVTFSPAGRRGYHHRSTSAASQFSTGTTGSGHRPGAKYVHPYQQTPRPYTPPLAQSYPTSVIDSEHSNECPGGTEEEEHIRNIIRDASQRVPSRTPYPQNQSMLPSLRIQTSGSATRLV